MRWAVGTFIASHGRLAWSAAIALGLLGSPARAAVLDITAADVTTRSFSVAWVSSEPVSGATVRVFADADGLTELTGGLTVTLASLASPPALARGVVKVTVSGLAPATCYYYRTETTGTSTVGSPAGTPFPQICTASAERKTNDLDETIANDLIEIDLHEPDGVTAGAGTLLLVSIPGVGSHPVTAFAGQGAPAAAGVVDLNNLHDAATGETTEPAAGSLMHLTQFRGLLCSGLTDHKLLRYRRVPEHTETAVIGTPVSEVETGDACFFADKECDEVVDLLDAERVLTVFGAAPPACAFNPDLDIVDDGRIDVLDLQSVLNRFGQSAPFE